MSHRIEQINELILHELNSLLLSEVDFPKDMLVTITGVETSKDLRHAKAWISVLPEDRTQTAFKILKTVVGKLQRELNQRLHMKPLPRLRFVEDSTERKAADVEAVLDAIRKNR